MASVSRKRKPPSTLARFRSLSPGWLFTRIVIAAGITAIYWLVYSLLVFLLVGEANYITALLDIGAAEVIQLLLAYVIVVSFSIHFRLATGTRDEAQTALEASERNYRTLVESARQAIFIVDSHGILQFVNENGASLNGGNPQELVNKHVKYLHPELDGDALEYSIKEVVASGNSKQLEVELMQGVDRHWYDLSLQPIQSQSGEIDRVLGIARDVTKRNQDQEAIKQRTEELAVLYNVSAAVNRSLELQRVLDVALAEVLNLEMFSDNATGLICLLDTDSNTLKIAAHRGIDENHPCLSKAALIGECLCGLAVLEGTFQVSEDATTDQRHCHWPAMGHHLEVCLPLRVRDEPLGALNVRLPTRLELKEHQIKLLQALADQISVAIDNAQLYEAISKQQEQMRALSGRLAEVQESERQRLAYELHDQTGRDLTALGIQLNLIRSELEGENIEDVHTFLNEAQTLLVELTEQLRNIMADLRPPMLDDYGLMAAIRWYGSKVAARTNLAITVDGRESKPRLPPAAEMALFRIIQEALTNVTKHAEATEVAISLDHTDEITRLTIDDNGRGCEPRHLPRGNAQNGWGLRIMAERAEANGGRCWIESDPAESGTRVLVEIPR